MRFAVAGVPEVGSCELIEPVQCAMINVLPGPVYEPCKNRAQALVTSGCVHEHLFVAEPNCLNHVMGSIGCDQCWNHDRHICKLTDFAVTMINYPQLDGA